MHYVEHLSKDIILKELIEQHGILKLQKKKKIYLHLCTSIMSQQLSTKVASVFQKRFLNLFDSKEPSAEAILNMPFQKLRGIGLSNSKANYILNVCRFFTENKITDTQLHKMSDNEIMSLLIQIKGVGKWTIEMLLMFYLGREDIFAIDDLGLRQAIINLYKLKSKDKKLLNKKILKISDSWQPYRSYASLYLWRWKDIPLAKQKL